MVNLRDAVNGMAGRVRPDVGRRVPRARDPSLLRSIGIRVRALRGTRGWTQEELAARTRMQASAVSRIESGDLGFTLTTASVIARALGVPIGRLFEDPDLSGLTLEELAVVAAWRRLPSNRRRAFLDLIEWCGSGDAEVRYVVDASR
jgi:transcriptional regulator with XRE-family HTH domain